MTEIKTLKLAQIKPYWRNARNIDEAVKQVKKSIELYGYNQFILVDKDYVIIAGHVRYKALLELGYEEATCIVSDMPAEQAKEYRIIDNKSHEAATWINDLLAYELKELPNLDNFAEFFNEGELDLLLTEASGQNVENVTTYDVGRVNELLDSKFIKTNQQELSEYIGVTCPTCGEDFSIKRQDVLSKFKK